ncbi:MAG: MFS transporter [Steroidobacteraceae bacterium]
MNGPAPATVARALPPGIWALGLVSMFMDISSELVHSLLPVFMVTVLGASMVTVGVIEGIAEAAASFTKVFSGAISDHFGKRKLLVVLGYGLGAVAKPMFPLAPSIGWVFAGRFLDRIGKGIRGAPRDALIADITPLEQRGIAYGLRQSLDSVGAFVGPLLAIAFMAILASDIQAVLWIAVVPAFIAVVILVAAVHEPAGAKPAAGPRAPLRWAVVTRLPRRYWLITLLGAVLTLARFSEAFLVLRAQDVGIALHYVPVVMVVMSAVFALAAYPAGALADRFSRRMLLIAGLFVLVGADLVLALADSPLLALFGAALWGLHMALTQGLLSVLVAEASPAELRGTAFGLFNLFSGGALLLASVIAGSLWATLGPAATFLAGALFAGVATVGMLLYRPSPQATRT